MENTAWTPFFMLLVVALGFMIGWVLWRTRSAAGKMPRRMVAELSEQREPACSPTQQHRQFKEMRSVLNDAHKHIVAVSKALKIPPAKPHKINGRISSIRPFHKVWVMRHFSCFVRR